MSRISPYFEARAVLVAAVCQNILPCDEVHRPAEDSFRLMTYSNVTENWDTRAVPEHQHGQREKQQKNPSPPVGHGFFAPFLHGTSMLAHMLIYPEYELRRKEGDAMETRVTDLRDKESSASATDAGSAMWGRGAGPGQRKGQRPDCTRPPAAVRACWAGRSDWVFPWNRSADSGRTSFWWYGESQSRRFEREKPQMGKTKIKIECERMQKSLHFRQ